MPAEPHDRAYRRFFQDRRMVIDLLRGFLDAEWVEHLDFRTLRQISDVLISAELERRNADSIWHGQWKGRYKGKAPVYIFLALEFQSTPDPWMPIRILLYLALLYDRLVASGELAPGNPLPPILPLVLYNGSAAWTTPTDISEMVAQVPGLEAFRPSLRYLLIDEKNFPPAKLEDLPNRVAALFQLEQSAGPEDLTRGIRRVLELLPHQDDPLRPVFTTWLRHVLLPSRAPGAEIPEVDDLERFQTMLEESVLNWTEQWKLEGLEKGLKKGRREGRREGLEKGIRKGRREEARDLVRLQLEQKFSAPLDAATLDRLDRADLDHLQGWARRLLAAATLDEVFQED